MGLLFKCFFFGVSYEIINDNYITQLFYDDLVKVDGRVIFDSAFKYISFPMSYFNVFVSLFFRGFGETCYEFKDIDSKYFICYDESLIINAQLLFLINNQIYKLYFGDLFKKNKDGGYELLIRFYKENDNVFCFGNPFVNSFVISYDYEEKKISFFGNSYSYEQYLNRLQSKKNEENSKNFIAFMKFIGIAIEFVVAIIILLGFVECIKEKCKQGN